MSSGHDRRTAAHRSGPARPLHEHGAELTAAVQAATRLDGPARWELRAEADRVELHAVPSSRPTVDPTGRSRAIGGGVALRNLELAVAHLGHRPVTRLQPNPDDALHLATVLAGARARPRSAERWLHRAMGRQHEYRRPLLSTSPVPPATRQRIRDAGNQPGVRATSVEGEPLRIVGTVLAAATSYSGDGDELADVVARIVEHRPTRRSPFADRAALIDQLRNGTLTLFVTASDQPADWIRSGWALQNAWLTAASAGLAGSVVAGVLDAPGVRSALTARLRLDGCPQLLLHTGWPKLCAVGGW